MKVSKNFCLGFIEAMVLLCKREGCKWTLNVVKNKFLPMLLSWREGKLDNTKAATIVTVLGKFFRIISGFWAFVYLFF